MGGKKEPASLSRRRTIRRRRPSEVELYDLEQSANDWFGLSKASLLNILCPARGKGGNLFYQKEE